MKSLFRKFRDAQRPFCTMIVAAAGSSMRMGGGNKLLMPLDGIPVLARTLLAIDRASCVDEILIAARESDILTVSDLCKTFGIAKPTKVLRGGSSRAESVYLAALQADRQAALIAVQDGDRPLIQTELIDAVIQKAASTAAAVPAVPLKDTVKVAQAGVVVQTPPRESLYAVQTPQVFDSDLLRAALQSALQSGAEITDDASAVERMGKQVFIMEGDPGNIKITTPIDLIIAEAILQEREGT